jgi:hypothetical protein
MPLHFSVPKNGVHVTGGNLDADYMVFGIKLKRRGSTLELWFGPTAFSPEPNDQQLIASKQFSQKNVFNSSDQAIGLDTQGRAADNRLWRRMGTIGSGAKYEKASPEEAEVFDRIIGSACFMTYPTTNH